MDGVICSHLCENHYFQVDDKFFHRKMARDEVTGEWRKLHNEELHDLYSSPSIIRMIKSRKMRLRMMKWVGHVARMGEKRNAYRLLLGKPEAMRLLERPRCRWVDNIKMDLGEIGWGRCGLDWSGSG
jgi:hypothetical protein